MIGSQFYIIVFDISTDTFTFYIEHTYAFITSLDIDPYTSRLVSSMQYKPPGTGYSRYLLTPIDSLNLQVFINDDNLPLSATNLSNTDVQMAVTLPLSTSASFTFSTNTVHANNSYESTIVKDVEFYAQESTLELSMETSSTQSFRIDTS